MMRDLVKTGELAHLRLGGNSMGPSPTTDVLAEQLRAEIQVREAWQQFLGLQDDIRRRDIERRLESMNELRGQIEAERGQYLTRELFDREHKAIQERVMKLEALTLKASGTIWAIGALISAVVALVTIMINVIFHTIK